MNLTCLVWSAHQDLLSYTWYKGGQQLLGPGSLSLPSATVSDATSYRCGVGLPGRAPHLSRPVTLDVLCEFGWMWAVVERATETHGAQGMESLLVSGLRTTSQLWGTGQGTLRGGGNGDGFLSGGEHTCLEWVSTPEPCEGRAAHGLDVRGLSCHLQTGLLSLSSADAPRSLRLTYLLETQGRRLALVLCTVDSRPPAQLTLSHGGQLLASSTEASAPNTLRLELQDPRPSEEGLYSCSAHSPLGKANTSLELRLEGKAGTDQGCGEGTACSVQLGPADSGLLGSGVQVKMSPSGTVPEGEPVTVTCEDPAALSPALYAWFHNGRWLQEGAASSLQFPVTTRAHAGAYLCQVHDAQGIRSSKPASLQILCEQGRLRCDFLE